ncbi:hypothetical protein FHS39_001958 [Streptomyces olivoverticillatus]|uniref:DUF397 domain-containing protein n=1 Tax=Streptomyces olivoverticillatus TaxID=66427 RepID=A0A7W7LMP3_9ACTN|nr:DUF397 domain-containing protein [Streptomyces olivoverticillatus]MBB4892947.1 hypothetical protein [Streptomyces olivoverticillatus]
MTGIPDAAWRKSSYSGSNQGECVEIADGTPGGVPVRDSKHPDGPALTFEPAAWRTFVAAVKNRGIMPS